MSNSSRASRRYDRGLDYISYPLGTESGLPLIVCPDCNLARVIELRVVVETANKGRCFFGVPKPCAYFKWLKDYVNELVCMNIVRICWEQVDDVGVAVDDEHDSSNKMDVVMTMKEMDLRLNSLETNMWKTKMFIASFLVLVLVAKFL